MKPLNVTDQNFLSEVIQSDIPVMIDFWAPWCGPCKMVGPIIEELAGEFEGKVKVCKLDTDKNGVSQQLGIKSIPTVAIFLKGKAVDVIVGARTKRVYIKALNAIIKKADKIAAKEAKKNK